MLKMLNFICLKRTNIKIKKFSNITITRTIHCLTKN